MRVACRVAWKALLIMTGGHGDCDDCCEYAGC